ncbi:MAG: tRNA lysidine(34) synthetase TilS [Clostridia bacterium]|nr:tRNA lysidine(34) synthetase TilS [Clostridia bacterium]
MVQDFLTEIRRNLTEKCGVIPGNRLLVALSGGADSVALLHALHSLSPALGISVCAAHFNHMIRGEEAQRDQRLAQRLCASLGIPLTVGARDVPALARESATTLETAARAARYEFLRRVMPQQRADCIAVAHHMDDQAESIMLHLIRGSGMRGLLGMCYRSGDIVRPMLSLRRAQVVEYIAQNGLEYCTDSTNLIADGARNRLRLDVLPYVREHLNPRLDESLCSMAELLTEDEAYLSAIARDALDSARLSRGYSRTTLMELPAPILSRALRMALKEAGVYADIERKHIDALTRFLSARTGARLHIPHIIAKIDYDSISFGAEVHHEPYCVPLPPGEAVTAGGFTVRAALCDDPLQRSPHVAFLDADKLNGTLCARTRRDGDRFHPLGASGAKKLKDVLIDKKIPREGRCMPVICDEDSIVYVYGLCVAETAKVDEHTRRILKITFDKRPNMDYND